MSNGLDYLIPARTTPADIFRFGVVTGVNPLRVKLDGDTDPTLVTPIMTCAVANGDRIFAQIHNRQLMVVGKVGGFWGIQLLGATEDLNNFDQTGSYHQPLTAQAGSGTNYPVTSAGLLEVTRGDDGTQIFQRYTQYLAQWVYVRTRYQGTWNAWKRVLVEDNDGAASAQRLRLTATNDASETSTLHPFQIGPDGGYRVVADTNEWLVFSSGTTYGNFFFHGAMLGLQGRTTDSTFGPFLEEVNSGARAGLKHLSGAGYFQVENMWTTTSAANCYVATSGTLYRSTSVRAAKLVIEDIKTTTLDALEKVRVRTWFDRRDAEQIAADIENGTDERTEAGPLKRQTGVVAEEIEELGLEEFLTRGEDQRLEGVAYDRFGVAAIALIRRQAQRITDLEERLAKLEELVLGQTDRSTP